MERIAGPGHSEAGIQDGPLTSGESLYQGISLNIEILSTKADLIAARPAINLTRQERESYRKAQRLDSAFRKNPIFQIISKIRENADDTNNDSTLFHTQFSSPEQILEQHHFNHKDSTESPVHQISQHYLTIIDTWLNEYLLDPEKNDWHMIITDNSKLKTISDLAKRLLNSINPESQPDQIKHTIKRLSGMTNEGYRWKRQRKIDRKEALPYLEDLRQIYILNGSDVPSDKEIDLLRYSFNGYSIRRGHINAGGVTGPYERLFLNGKKFAA